MIQLMIGEIFRAYDIRGVVGKTLSTEGVHKIAATLGTIASEAGEQDFFIGHDGRLSSPELARALKQGLIEAGQNVVDLGLVGTPMLYFAIENLAPTCGVMLTASHNPKDYNGLKIVLGGKAFCGDKLQTLAKRVQTYHPQKERPGHYSAHDIRPQYFEAITHQIKLSKPLKVVVDCGNGVAGSYAPEVLSLIGCEVIPLFCDVDGRFPNHDPDPIEPNNLRDLIRTVQREEADVGFALDGDGDRVVVITGKGEVIWPDRLLILFIEDVLKRNPKATIMYDVKSTRLLESHIRAAGGEPLMWQTGHSFIRNKMREIGAPLAGEMSGHIFFKDRWFGFDDGLYVACRLLEVLSKSTKAPNDIFASLPTSVATPEYKVPILEAEKKGFIEKLIAQNDYPSNAKITTLDGLRIDLPDAWGLVRASNTTPHLTVRFEGDNQEALERIQTLFREKVLSINPRLIFPV